MKWNTEYNKCMNDELVCTANMVPNKEETACVCPKYPIDFKKVVIKEDLAAGWELASKESVKKYLLNKSDYSLS